VSDESTEPSSSTESSETEVPRRAEAEPDGLPDAAAGDAAAAALLQSAQPGESARRGDSSSEGQGQGKGLRKDRLALVLLLLLLILALLTGSAWWLVNRGKAAPGTQIGSIAVGGMTRAEIEAEVKAHTVDIPITVAVLGLPHFNHSATAGELGVSVDAAGLAEQAISAGNGLGLFTRLNPFSVKQIDLVVNYSVPALQAAISALIPPSDAPTNPVISFDDDTKLYGLSEGTSGWGLSATRSVDALKAVVETGAGGVVEMREGPVEPSVSNVSAGQTVSMLNQMLASGVTLASQGESIHTFGAADLVSFVSVSVDSTAGVFRIDADRNAITAALGEVVISTAAKPLPKYTLVDGDGKELTVLREGRPARTLSDVPGTVAAIAGALSSGVSTVETQWNESDAGSQTITVGGAHDGHWIDVHLDSQTATTFDGDKPIKTYLISGGLPSTPTPQGSFQIWVKELDTDIFGSDYYYDHIVWVGWNNMYALHTAYWHDNFGEPMSHGCINMRPADILEVYDWLDYGDWVEVHP
jgi:lipoprotein-anchoring transpeptidase ErfK/SrfK